MSYVGRISNPSGLTMESQRGPNYSVGRKVEKSATPKDTKNKKHAIIIKLNTRHNENR